MTVLAPLVRVLRRRLRALTRHVPRALDEAPRSLHRARVASRRLREVVPVAATALAGVKPAKARRVLRRVTRALGPVRETDVALATLGERRFAHVARPAVELVRARLLDERRRRCEAMGDRIGALNLTALVERLRARASEGAVREGPWRGALARRVARRTSGLRRAIDAAGSLYAPDALHLVRIAAKKLRYALELTDETGTVCARDEVRALRRVQDRLGRLHDLQVLRVHVHAAAASAASAVPPGALESLARAIDDECRALHARYLSAVPRLRDLGQRVTRTIVPAVRTSAVGTARPRPLKMMLQRPRAQRRVVPGS
jgi:CHAD domain-containing protein